MRLAILAASVSLFIGCGATPIATAVRTVDVVATSTTTLTTEIPAAISTTSTTVAPVAVPSPPATRPARSPSVRVAARSTPIRWDDVANCESSGRWDLNTGNGFYGGLQFTIGTWRSYGGSGMPNEHTREEQIDVAERAAAGDGIMHTWPICGRFA